jgi:NAD(P)-dependent dehydrogenase (short-subunit alcohol dehydrogenase family)
MSQRTWFITGVSGGFGRHMTEQLLERSDRVAGTARKLEALDDLKTQYGDQLWVASLDVTDTPAIHRVVGEAFAAFGRIDVIVNNAGYGLFGAAEELSDEQINHQINTNVIGSIQVVRAALPHLRAQGGGRILQLSSMGGQIAFPGLSLYHTSKWAIEGFFESTAQDIAPFNIQTTLDRRCRNMRTRRPEPRAEGLREESIFRRVIRPKWSAPSSPRLTKRKRPNGWCSAATLTR